MALGNESQPTNESPRRSKLVLDHETKTLMTDSRINESLRAQITPMLKFLCGKKLWFGYQILYCPWCLKHRAKKIDEGNSQMFVQ